MTSMTSTKPSVLTLFKTEFDSSIKKYKLYQAGDAPFADYFIDFKMVDLSLISSSYTLRYQITVLDFCKMASLTFTNSVISFTYIDG